MPYLSVCLDCPKGTFGQNCSSSCTCQNGGTCWENGFCFCLKGWSGDDCSQRGNIFIEKNEMFAYACNNKVRQCQKLHNNTLTSCSLSLGPHLLIIRLYCFSLNIFYFIKFILHAPVECDPGSFFNSTRNTCQFCPLSQYQDESGQTYCKNCPNGKITKILGTTSKAGCISKFMRTLVYIYNICGHVISRNLRLNN